MSVVQFDRFRFDKKKRELTGPDNKVIRLPKRSKLLLNHLILHPETTVPREALLRAVSPELKLNVERNRDKADARLRRAILVLRRATEQFSENPELFETLECEASASTRQGIRLNAAVVEEEMATEDPEAAQKPFEHGRLDARVDHAHHPKEKTEVVESGGRVSPTRRALIASVGGGVGFGVAAGWIGRNLFSSVPAQAGGRLNPVEKSVVEVPVVFMHHNPEGTASPHQRDIKLVRQMDHVTQQLRFPLEFRETLPSSGSGYNASYQHLGELRHGILFASTTHYLHVLEGKELSGDRIRDNILVLGYKRYGESVDDTRSYYGFVFAVSRDGLNRAVAGADNVRTAEAFLSRIARIGTQAVDGQASPPLFLARSVTTSGHGTMLPLAILAERGLAEPRLTLEVENLPKEEIQGRLVQGDRLTFSAFSRDDWEEWNQNRNLDPNLHYFPVHAGVPYDPILTYRPWWEDELGERQRSQILAVLAGAGHECRIGKQPSRKSPELEAYERRIASGAVVKSLQSEDHWSVLLPTVEHDLLGLRSLREGSEVEVVRFQEHVSDLRGYFIVEERVSKGKITSIDEEEARIDLNRILGGDALRLPGCRALQPS